GMFACKHDAPVDLAQIAIVLLARRFRPFAAAAQRERHAVPCDRDAVLELGLVLRMNLAAELDRARHALIGRHGGELEGIGALEQISAEQDAASALVEA